MRLAKWVLGTDKWCTCCFRLARCIRLFCCAHRLRSASWARSHAASTARSSRSIAQEMTRVGFHKLSNHRRSTTLYCCPFREDPASLNCELCPQQCTG